MRIVTWNVNGIRAAIRKGLDKFIDKMNADVLMLQEVRCLPEQLPKDWKVPEGYEMILHPAEKKGYSGVATLSKGPMKEQGRGMKGSLDPTDSEGRVLITEHDDLLLVNTYQRLLKRRTSDIQRDMDGTMETICSTINSVRKTRDCCRRLEYCSH